MEEPDRLQLLLEFSRSLPELPEHLADHPELLEQVVECQSPLFLALELGDAPEQPVEIFFSAPPEAPTTRGFAAVLHEGLNGLPADEILGFEGAKDLSSGPYLRTFPHRHGSDGFFAAVLKRGK